MAHPADGFAGHVFEQRALVGENSCFAVLAAVVGAFQTYPLRKELPVASYLKYVFIPLISGVIMYVCVRAVSRVLKPGIAGIAIEILTGAVIYLAINLVYLLRSKNEVFEDVLRK